MTDVFAALADPNRRHLLEELAGRREASVTDLAESLPVTRQAVAKHLAALASAGLVESRRAGRERLYCLNRSPLDGAAGWIARVGSEWDERLVRLRDHLGDCTCMTGVAPVRAKPDAASEQVTQALRGEPLTVRERRGDWARIETAYGYSGWIAAENLSLEPPGAWLPEAREGDPVVEARAYVGSPYLWGGMSERGIDCSGLVHMAFRRLGRLVPRDAKEQESAAERVEHPRSGDLVTYGVGGSGTHIAFWLGGGRILHAADERGVLEEPESPSLRSMQRGFIRFSHPVRLPRSS
ncbi:MAG: metalloregulator ArsR/SmtB family transcription factor [Gaiellaceae bacterium]